MIEFKLKSITREWVHTFCLVLISSIISAAALQYTKSIMIPFVLSLLIAFSVLPLIELFHRRYKLPRIVAIILTFAIVVTCIIAVFLVIAGNVRVFAENITIYKAQFFEAAKRVLGTASNYGLDLKKDNILEALRNIRIFDYVGATASKVFSFTINTILVVTFVFFLLTGKPQNLPTTGIWSQMSSSIRKYLVTKSLTSFITGSLTAVILSFLGLEMAYMFGILAFILNFIPTLGSMVAVLLPLPIALLQFDSSVMITLTLLLPGCLQFLIGSMVEPFYVGDVLDLHPVTILLALMFWGLLWGIPGAILATPISVIIKICLSQFEGSKPFAEILSGRLPKLSNIETDIKLDIET